jgi:hypothetical protein
MLDMFYPGVVLKTEDDKGGCFVCTHLIFDKYGIEKQIRDNTSR